MDKEGERFYSLATNSSSLKPVTNCHKSSEDWKDLARLKWFREQSHSGLLSTV